MPWRTSGAFLRAAKTFCRCSACSSTVREYTKMSSKNTRTKTSRYPARTSLIMCMNCEGALVTPNGITRNSYKPQRILNAVFGMSCSQIGICQYPDFKSILLNTLAPPRRSNISSGNGKGIPIPDCPLIQPTVVNAEPKAAVFLWCKKHWCAIRRV